MNATANDLHARGLARLDAIHGEAGRASLARLDGLNPDLSRWIVESAFGGVYDRPGLDLKTRQICTVAALAAMGNAPDQLKSHVRGALNMGWTGPEIFEVIMQMAVYGGAPAAMNSALAAKDVFDELGVSAMSAARVQGGEGTV